MNLNDHTFLQTITESITQNLDIITIRICNNRNNPYDMNMPILHIYCMKCMKVLSRVNDFRHCMNVFDMPDGIRS